MGNARPFAMGGDEIAWAGLFAGEPAPTGTASVVRLADNLVGAGLPAKRPAQDISSPLMAKGRAFPIPRYTPL
ncbi:hypothetical protein D3C75_1048840 [compost metagenome]